MIAQRFFVLSLIRSSVIADPRRDYTSDALEPLPLQVVLPGFPSEFTVRADFINAIDICDKLSRKPFVAGWEGQDGFECFEHELKQLRRLCCQMHCLVHYWIFEFRKCLRGFGLSQDNGTCGQYVAGFGYVLRGDFDFFDCGIQEGLAKLSVVLSAGTPKCFGVKLSLYNDMDAYASDLVQHIASFYSRANTTVHDGTMASVELNAGKSFVLIMFQFLLWVDSLQILWVLYRLAIAKKSTWPIFRAANRMEKLQRPAQVLARIVEFLLPRSPRRRIVFAEVGVFLGNLSEELLRLVPSGIGEMHLVDPWDNNAEFRSIRGDMETAWPVQNGHAYMSHVRRKMQTLKGSAFCGVHPYVLPDSNCFSDPSRVAVTIHHEKSTTAAQSLGSLQSVDRGLFDLVFIDGSHEFEDVLSDFESWWPLVRPGGVLAGHDFSVDHLGVPLALLHFLDVTLKMKHAPEVILDAASVFWLRKPIT